MFCHLHVHDEHSLLDGVGKAENYLNRAKELGQEYLALTNHGNIDGLITFQSAAKKIGVKPILGCELYVVEDMFKKAEQGRFHMTVLIKNEIGFQNLCKMLTMANLKGFYYKPRIGFEEILKHCEGLVFLSGCTLSPLRSIKGQLFISNLSGVIPGDVYLEVMPHSSKEQEVINSICTDISDTTGLPLVATNDCHYIDSDDSNLHEVLLAIQTKKKWADKDRFKFSINTLFLRSEDEMKEAFVAQGSLRKSQYLMAMRNTIEIAKKCCNFEIKKKEVWLPELRGLPEEQEEKYLESICNEGYGLIFKEIKWDHIYLARFEEEFDLIKKKKFVRYFLIVHELVSWCKRNDVMTGPGRGSCGGSLIAYLMGITNVDPIKYDLLFSRFINEDRIDYPDIDLDFEDSKRHLVRQHLEELYGKNNIASVSTFNKMKGRGVVRDVSRVFDIPLDEVGEFAKSIIDEENDSDSVLQAVKDTPEGQRFAAKYPEVVDYAIRLEGQIRTCSQHAAALIVSAEDLAQGTRGNLAVRSDQEVINWSKDDAEYMGLMKLDVLGLNTLSVLSEARELIRKNHGKEIVFESISMDNEQVFEMLSRGETVGVFQFNTWATTKLCKDIGIDNFGLMSDIVALVRPGPADSGMAADFTKRKHGTKWHKKHRLYERITKSTYGLIVYQEQVMQVINLVAGLPYNVADKIRKIVAKKRDVKMFAKYKEMFVNGCRDEGTLSNEEADEFWGALEKHANYSFNKSHSASYAMLAYWCSFLKLYFPAEFICANLTYGAEGKKEELVSEARRMGLRVVLPRLGVSDAIKWSVKSGGIYVPFKEVKGVGEKLAEEIAAFRLKTSVGFFDDIDVVPTGKMGQIIKEIGANGEPPTGNLFEYFSFDIADIINPQINNRDCYIMSKNWRDPELIYCKNCGLRREAKQPVLPSRGIYNVMVIGEAPGRKEDENGKGFIGKAGDLLWNELLKYGYSRRQFHVTNVCKCFPRDSKTPNSDHISACSNWLDGEIRNTGTRLCLALGNAALRYFKGEDGGITKISGTTEWIESKGVWVCWNVHPSSVLRNPANRSGFESGIKNFTDKIREAGGFR